MALNKYLTKTNAKVAGAVAVGAGTTAVSIWCYKRAKNAIEKAEVEHSEAFEKSIENLPEDAVVPKYIPLAFFDKVKACWKFAVPPLVGSVTTAWLLYSACHDNVAREEAFQKVLSNGQKVAAFAAGTANAVDKASSEVLTEKNKEKFKSAFNTARAENAVNTSPLEATRVVDTGHGDTLFYDPIINVVFKSSKETIETAIANLNASTRFDDKIPYNDVCEALDIPCVPIGDLLWISKHSDGIVEARFDDATLPLGSPDTPCTLMELTSVSLEFEGLSHA